MVSNKNAISLGAANTKIRNSENMFLLKDCSAKMFDRFIIELFTGHSASTGPSGCIYYLFQSWGIIKCSKLGHHKVFKVGVS